MKDFIKTIILVCVIGLIGVLIFYVVGNKSYYINLFSRTDLDINDPTVIMLFDRVKNNTHLRKPNMVSSELSSDEIIKFTIDSLAEGDYKDKKIKAEKITCSIGYGVFFTTNTGSCNIRIISNQTFMNYQKKYFNTEIPLDFIDLKYHGLKCENANNNYYCLKYSYFDNLLGYSVFNKAYKDKDHIYIQEYYLNVDLEDRDKCISYFGEEYCNNYTKAERPPLDEEFIKKQGVLFEHVFSVQDDNYYLEKSYTVNER